MKIKNVGLAVATIAIVGCGSLVLATSMTQIKGAVQNEAGGGAEISTNVGNAHVSVKEGETENDVDNVNVVLGFENSFDKKIKLYPVSNARAFEDIEGTENVAILDYVYEGKVVRIRDGLVTKEEAVGNVTKIMDYIYSYVNDLVFVPNGINKDSFEYRIQRQYGRMYKGEEVNYAVFLNTDDGIVGAIGITLGEEPLLHSFTMDGLVGLYGGIANDIPREYLIRNWCATTNQRTEIYNQYFTKSEDILQNVLGLTAIRKEIVDVNCGSYFNADDSWSRVCFGYVLEDGTYIKVFYNRVDGEWVGFCIAGYYEE